MLYLLKIDNVVASQAFERINIMFCVILKVITWVLALIYFFFLFALSIFGQTAGKSIILFWNVALNYI